MPPAGYLPGVREICDKYGIVLILDEVMAGFGRTGQWLALDAYDVVPDLVTFAKGVNSGYVPVGGVMLSAKISRAFHERVLPGGLTYSGHLLAAADMGAIKKGLLDAGMLPFIADNRIHVVPPAVVTPDEARRGLAIIDGVLASR